METVLSVNELVTTEKLESLFRNLHSREYSIVCWSLQITAQYWPLLLRWLHTPVGFGIETIFLFNISSNWSLGSWGTRKDRGGGKVSHERTTKSSVADRFSEGVDVCPVETLPQTTMSSFLRWNKGILKVYSGERIKFVLNKSLPASEDSAESSQDNSRYHWSLHVPTNVYWRWSEREKRLLIWNLRSSEDEFTFQIWKSLLFRRVGESSAENHSK